MNNALKIARCILWVMVVFLIMMPMRTHRRMILQVDSFTMHDTVVTMGRHSDICMDKVPQDYMTVSSHGNSFTWRINDYYIQHDSLFYFRVNNRMPNLYRLSGSSVIHVRTDEGVEQTLTRDELKSLLRGHDSHYVMMRNVLALRQYRQQQEGTDSSSIDWTRRKDLKSFFYHDDDGWSVAILDTRTTLSTDEGDFAYQREGTVEGVCKLQFFEMKESNYRPDHVDRDMFRIGEINYMAKPVLLTTEWGAGHYLLSHQVDGGIGVHFPKPITYVESIDTLCSLAGDSTAFLTLQQDNAIMPLRGSIFLPTFSSTNHHHLCNLWVTPDSLCLDGRRIDASWNLTPQLSPQVLSGQHGDVHMRTGIIDWCFILSYLWVPFIVFLLLYFAYPMLTDMNGVRASERVNSWSTYLPQHFQTILLIAFCYCICRVQMAFRLSYTFPYFDKLTGIIVVSTALLMLLVFILSLILNHDYLTVQRRRHQGLAYRQWWAVGVSAVVFLLCIYTFMYMDRNFSYGIINSYMPGEVWSLNPFHWTHMNGVNDTHRSVPYTLMLFCGAGIVVLALMNVVIPRLPRIHTKYANRAADTLQQRMQDWIIPRAHGALLQRHLRYAIMVIVFLVRHALVPCTIVMLLSLFPGNFATAFITVGVVLGQSHVLSQIEFSNGRWVSFWQMAWTSVAFILSAILFADKGYMTNYLGFIFTFVLLYFMWQKNRSWLSKTPEEMKAERMEHKWLPRIAMMMVVGALFLPSIVRLCTSTESVDYGRMQRRMNMFAQYEQYRNSGYRYAMSDTEFMTIMMHSMFNTDGADPISNDRHALHPAISTGQSPVVLNDLALPSAYIGGYGWMAYVPYFGLLVILLFVVLYYGLRPTLNQREDIEMDRPSLWRLMSVMMWVGTTLYLYMSYIGQFPFTGRLNPGFGVDSVGESLETAILLAFMTATRLRNTKPSNK